MDFELDMETMIALGLAICGGFVVLIMFGYWSTQGLKYSLFIRLITAALTAIVGFFVAKFIFTR